MLELLDNVLLTFMVSVCGGLIVAAWMRGYLRRDYEEHMLRLRREYMQLCGELFAQQEDRLTAAEPPAMFDMHRFQQQLRELAWSQGASESSESGSFDSSSGSLDSWPHSVSREAADEDDDNEEEAALTETERLATLVDALRDIGISVSDMVQAAQGVGPPPPNRTRSRHRLIRPHRDETNPE